jgi:hypothetical protein
MRRHRHPRRAMRRSIVVLTIAALASACAGHSSPQAGPDTTATGSATPATSTTAPDPKAAVLAAYQRFWQVWLAANNPPNPNDPRLAEVATGSELRTVQLSIGNKVINGTYTRLPPHARYRHEPTVISTRESRVVIRDCQIDDSQIVVRATGRIVNGDVVTELLTSTVVRFSGRWRVESVRETREWRGVHSCV